MTDPWAAYDAWEARDRTLLEAAAIRARRLGYPEDPNLDPEPATAEPLDGQLELHLVPPVRYPSPPPTPEPRRASRPVPR